MLDDNFWFDVFRNCLTPINVILFPGYKLYQNPASSNLFQSKRIRGGKCYKIIAGKEKPCEFCQALEVYQNGKSQTRRKKFKGMTLEILISPLVKNGAIIGAIESILNMTPVIEYQEDLKRMAITDSLTDTLNRRGITELIEQEIIRSRRFGDFSLLMIDVDNLKIINDTLGHHEGDEVLKKIANIIKERLRVTDIVSRFGGDEYVAMLPQTELEGAKKLAEKLRRAVEKNTRATISIGVIQFSLKYSSEKLLQTVDRALYNAKKRKNKVVTIV